MNINKRTGIPLYILGIIILGLVAFLFFSIGDRQTEEEINQVREDLGYSESDVVDVIGTKATPYRFSDDAAASAYSTTTEVIFIGNDINVVDFNIHAIEASSTMDVILMVESSNDASCSANGSGLIWVDSSPTTTTAKTTTTTYPFTLAAGHGGKFQITNWNGLCARVSIGSASSTVWVSVSKQSLNKN